MSQGSRILYTPPEFKKKKAFRKTWFFIFGLGFLLVFILSAAIYLLRLPQLQIHTIEVLGLKSFETGELLSGVWGLLEGKYLWLIPKSSALILGTDSVENYLKNVFPRIAEVNVNKVLPDRLSISVKEREFFGILCNDFYLPTFVGTTTSPNLRNPEPQCAYLDNTGFAYEEGPNSFGSLITKINIDAENLKIPSQVLDDKLMEEMIFLKKRTNEAAGINIIGYEFLFRVPREIKVLTGDGFKIIFSREDDLENSFRVLKKVLEEEIKERRGSLEYIDLRFGNKVFYKSR